MNFRISLVYRFSDQDGLSRQGLKQLFVCAVFLFLYVFSNASFAQLITLHEKNAPLSDILEKIRLQTNYDLIGDKSLLTKTSLLTISVDKKELAEVLAEISRNQPIIVRLQNRTLLVQAKNASNSKDATQTFRIVGIVRGSEGNPLAGAVFRNANTGAFLGSSQQSGGFAIIVSEEDLIQVSMVGYEPYRFNPDGRRELNISLRASSTAIEETVVTGYGTRNKNTFTGSSSTITRKELERFNNSNIFSIIQNLDPAFKVQESNQYGSDPNRVPEITIRGTTSVGEYGLNAPLVIMDGFEVPITRLYDLDVNRIETITLLKDASSTVLYGSRGGNGVIVIETRLPRAEGISVTYNIRPELAVVDLSDYNLMNAAEKIAFEKLAGAYTYAGSASEFQHESQAKLDNLLAQRQLDIANGVDTYWLSQPVETNMSTSQSLRLEGGFGNMRFSLEGNYGVIKGVMKGSERKRMGGGLNLFYRSPNKISFRNTTNLVGSRATNSNYGDFSLYTQLNPYYRIYDLDGYLIERYAKGGEGMGSTEWIQNPLYNASLPYRDFGKTFDITNNMDLEYFINPFLRFQLRGVIGKSFSDGEKYISPRNTLYKDIPDVRQRGLYIINAGNGINYAGTAIMTFAKVFAKKHAVSASGVFELNSSKNSSNSTTLAGFADDRFVSPALALNYKDDTRYSYTNVPERRIGFMGTANYIFDERFYLDLSLRTDGSSKYGRNKRYGNFWASGVGYNLHKEDFLRDNKVINLLRVYYNMGISGTDNLEASLTNTIYSAGFNSLYNEQMGFYYVSEGNPNLRWPQIKSYSAGINSALLNNRLNIRLEAYKRLTHNMATPISVAPSVGIANSTYTENLGKVENKGFEAQIDVKPYESSDKTFNVILRFQGAYNKSKLLEISEELKALNDISNKSNTGYQGVNAKVVPQSVYYEEGQSLQTIKGVRSLGIDPATGREVFLTLDNKLTYVWSPNDIQIIGNKEPRLFGNISGFINYRNFSLEAYFNYTIGGQLYNQTLVSKIENVKVWDNADKRVLYERWKEPGDQTLYKGITDLSTTQLSSRFVQTENYIRLGSVNFNYTMGQQVTQKLGLQRVRFNFSANDVFRFSTVRMERGLSYPFSRSYNLGLLVQY